jgi:hypothetical protein
MRASDCASGDSHHLVQHSVALMGAGSLHSLHDRSGCISLGGTLTFMQEPASPDLAPPVIPVATKKNRTVPPTDGEPLSRKTSAENQTVGEVRKKVEEMNWKENEAKKRANGHIGGENTEDTETPSTNLDGEDKAEADDPESQPIDGGWETIEATEAERASAEMSLKRKQLDRNDSSLAAVDGLKRTKEEEGQVSRRLPLGSPNLFQSTPVTPIEAETTKSDVKDNAETTSEAPESEKPKPPSDAAPAPHKKPQTTFASFSSSASPFSAGLKHTSAFGSAPAQPIASSSTSAKPSAFGSYSSAFSPFAVKDKNKTKPEDNADGSKSTFGDILACTQDDAGKDKGDKLQMTTQDGECCVAMCLMVSNGSQCQRAKKTKRPFTRFASNCMSWRRTVAGRSAGQAR